MHDLHAADRILQLSLAEAKKNNLKKINKIVIELGSVIEHGQEILPENLEFNLKMLAKNTIAANADILIKKIGTENWKLTEIEGD